MGTAKESLLSALAIKIKLERLSKDVFETRMAAGSRRVLFSPVPVTDFPLKRLASLKCKNTGCLIDWLMSKRVNGCCSHRSRLKSVCA